MKTQIYVLIANLAFAFPAGAQSPFGTSSAIQYGKRDSAAALDNLSAKQKAAAINSAPYAKLSEAIYRDAASVDTGKSGAWKRTEDSRAPITYDLPLTEGLGKPSERLSQGQLVPERLQLPDSDPMKPGIQLRDPIGFHASTYENRAENKIAIVFEGTSDKIRESLGDWSANIGNAVKLTGQPPKQYQEALSYAQREVARAKKECPACEIVVTGHSLGGGLAQYAVSQLAKQGVDLQGYTFNPAALGKAATGKDSSGRITNIIVQGDLIDAANRSTGILTTSVVGDSINLPLERSGALDAHGIDKLAKDLDSLATKERSKAEESSQSLSRTIEQARQIEKLKEEARRENREDRRIEYGADRFRDLDRSSEYQLSKSAIDIHGNRVRIDAYIRRPSPTQVEHWVLNFRDRRFDYGLTRRTYAQPLASLSEIGAMDLFSSIGSAAPQSNYIVRREEVMSNNQDQVYWNSVYGAPTLTLNQSGQRYYPRSIELTLRTQGAGYDNAKWRFTQTEAFDLGVDLNTYDYALRFPDSTGALAVYASGTILRQTGACFSCQTNPAIAPTIAGGSASRTIRFKDNTWLSSETWALNDTGTQVSLIFGADGRIAGDVNVERRVRTSEMQGRDIDFIFPAKFLIPDGSSPSTP